MTQHRLRSALGLALVTIAAGMIAATAVTANAAGPTLKAQKSYTPVLSIKLKCFHAGTPVEFPDDIKILNNTSFSLKAGTKVKWSMPSVNKSGIVTLPALAPGKTAFFPNVVPPMPAGVPCSAATV